MGITHTTGRQQESASSVGPEGLLPVAPNKPWTYFHPDNGWTYADKDKRWLPRLNHCVSIRGGNGIGDSGSMEPALAVIAAKGHKVIRPNDRMLGPYKDYLYSYSCISPGGTRGKYWVTAYQTPIVRGRRLRWNVDTAGYYEFLDYLVTKGIVSPMGEDILDEKLEAAQDRIERLAKHGANPVYAKKIKAAEKKTEQARLYKCLAPAPRR